MCYFIRWFDCTNGKSNESQPSNLIVFCNNPFCIMNLQIRKSGPNVFIMWMITVYNNILYCAICNHLLFWYLLLLLFCCFYFLIAQATYTRVPGLSRPAGWQELFVPGTIKKIKPNSIIRPSLVLLMY